MKILFFVLIAIAIIGLAECHGAHNHATPDFSKKNIHKAKENEIDHHHNHDSHDHDDLGHNHDDHGHNHGHKQDDIQKTADNHKTTDHHHENENFIMTNVIRHMNAFFERFADNKLALVSIGVLIISTPSVPAFIVLTLIQKFSTSKGAQKHVINEKILKFMICFACGSILGDVFLHIIPHISEGKNCN